MSDLCLPINTDPIPGVGAVSIYRSIAEIPAEFGPSVAAIGNFDGIHLGHKELFASVVSEARSRGMRAVAVTFDPHPKQFLHPASAPRLLTSIEERTRMMAAAGLDAVLVLHFDGALVRLTAKEFVDRVLVGALGVRGLHEGRNFHFGYGARAGVAALEEYGAGLGFAVHVHAPVKVRGMEVSSTAIRERVAAGDLTRARWMLGRPFTMFGTPARGRGVGTRLLVPTVNMAAYERLLPPFGVYVTRLNVAGHRFQAVTNVGDRPTFSEVSFAVESHILNFEPFEMDEQTPIELEFLWRLRPEMIWPTPEALKVQILKDVERAKRYFRLAR